MTASPKVTAVEVVRAHWQEPPEWVMKLAAACDKETQSSAAKKIRRSPSLVNQVLKNRYTGNLEAVERRVEAAFKDMVDCPILGKISGQACVDWQGKKRCGANHQLVRMYLACRKCPNNLSRRSVK